MTQIVDPRSIVARYQDTAPVNLDAIARDLGIAVYRENLDEEYRDLHQSNAARKSPKIHICA